MIFCSKLTLFVQITQYDEMDDARYLPPPGNHVQEAGQGAGQEAGQGAGQGAGGGGRVIPPNRPGHMDKYDIITPDRDAFMMDFENYCLEHCWDSTPQPKGTKRYEDPEWAAMIEANVYPHHSDVDWNEYMDWVSRGFGDEWFQEDEPPTRVIGCTRFRTKNKVTYNDLFKWTGKRDYNKSTMMQAGQARKHFDLL